MGEPGVEPNDGASGAHVPGQTPRADTPPKPFRPDPIGNLVVPGGAGPVRARTRPPTLANPPPPGTSRFPWLTRPVWGWALFDFANQSFTIVILTALFQVYFISMIVPGDPSTGRQVWALCGIITQILLVLIGPVVGALADFSGTKKRLLFVTYIGCVGLTFLLAFVQPGQVWFGAIVFVAAYLFYGAGENFLNAFLPELCTHREMGRVSAFSWTIAYIGALIALIVAVLLIAIVPGGTESVDVVTTVDGVEMTEEITRTSAFGYQVVTVWVALFFLAAGIPMFMWVPERHYRQPMPKGATLWTIGFVRIFDTMRHLRQFRQLFRFLAIMTVYFAGMQIVYWFGGTLTKELFGFNDTQMGAFLVLSTTVAVLGAALTARYSDRIGARNTILVALAFWSSVMLVASLAAGPFQRYAWLPWVLAALVGLGIGAIGTASRAMVGLFSPPQKAAEFFGFYGVAHKLSATLGLGWIAVMEWVFAGRFPLVVASSAIFFIVGFFAILFLVSEKEGRIVALRAALRPVRERPVEEDRSGR